MAVSKKGAVDASVIAGIAGAAAEGIEAGDVLCVVGAAPQVRVVGRNATQRVVSPNLLALAPLLAMDAVLTATVTPQGGGTGAVVIEYMLTLQDGGTAPAGTSLLVSWAAAANTLLVTLDGTSDPSSAIQGQAALFAGGPPANLTGLVWCSIGANGKVSLRFAGTAGDTINVNAMQSAGIRKPIGSWGIVLP